MSGKLFFGDNLEILRAHVKDATVDLVYLDPPFNSNASYNVLFRTPHRPAGAQTRAFEDTWRWSETAQRALDEMERLNLGAFKLLLALKASLGTGDTMAYLTMMSVRLVELRRVLKPTGSLYLHCDSTAAHYLKILMDEIFGRQNFRNEIVWKRSNTHNDSKTWGRVADTLLYYSNGPGWTWNDQRAALDERYVQRNYRFADPDGRRYRLDNISSPSPRPTMTYVWRGFEPPAKGWRYARETMAALDRDGRIWYPADEDGRPDTTRRPAVKRYLDEMKGGVIGTIWTDIPPIGAQARERLGYPTQKPLDLLRRIIGASSNLGDVVLDPFCGCGTAVHAAQEMGRDWIGIDIAYVAIKIICDRLKGHFRRLKFDVLGKPRDIEGARRLAQTNWHQFQVWAIACLGGHANRKGADGGIDGEVVFLKQRDAYGRCIVSVKGGQKTNPAAIRELQGVIHRENAELGILVCLEPPSGPMRTAAAEAGTVELFGNRIPRIRIASAQQLIDGFQLGVQATLDTIAAAEETRKRVRKEQKRPKRDRKQPQFLLPIAGRAEGQAPSKRNAELALDQPDRAPRRPRKRTA